MILKKPYAFIIKHFRIIHLILLIPMIYLLTQTREIMVFFRDYVSNGYMVSSAIPLANLANNYVNIFMYISVVLILAIFIILAFVLQLKDKPTKYYGAGIIYYIAMFGLLTGAFVIFRMIENDTLDSTFARIIRDLCLIVHYSQYIIIIFTAVRGVGFNIKQFNFKSDIEDLKISAEDSEEFEFLVGRDTYKTKRNIRRFIRELGYYYKENKFIFTVIFIVLAGILATTLFVNSEVHDKVYREKDTIAFGYLNMTVENSYMSSYDLKGKTIKNDKVYIAIVVKINNRYREDHPFNYPNVQLKVNKRYISPNLNVSNYFRDFADPYDGSPIKGVSENKYVLVYEIDKYLVNNDFEIAVFSGFGNSKENVGAVNKRIAINPVKYDSEAVSNEVNMGANINLGSTYLNKSQVSIKDFIFMTRFPYEYEYCLGSDCYTSHNALTISGNDIGRYTLMVVDYDLVLDDESMYMYSDKNYQNFFEDFMSIKYDVDGREYVSDVDLINPVNYSDKLVFKIDKDIVNATNIEAVLNIRNVSYEIKLK